MTTPSDPTQSPAQPPVHALATVDLGASSDETVGQATGRRIGGAVLMIVAGAATLGFAVLWLAGWAIPWFADWHDAIGEFLIAPVVVCFILTGLGFELLRRARKRKGEATPEPVALIGADDPIPTLNATPDSAAFDPAPATRDDEPTQGPLTTETRL